MNPKEHENENSDIYGFQKKTNVKYTFQDHALGMRPRARTNSSRIMRVSKNGVK
jgi:hypothetical protein